MFWKIYIKVKVKVGEDHKQVQWKINGRVGEVDNKVFYKWMKWMIRKSRRLGWLIDFLFFCFFYELWQCSCGPLIYVFLIACCVFIPCLIVSCLSMYPILLLNLVDWLFSLLLNLYGLGDDSRPIAVSLMKTLLMDVLVLFSLFFIICCVQCLGLIFVEPVISVRINLYHVMFVPCVLWKLKFH